MNGELAITFLRFCEPSQGVICRLGNTLE